MHIFKEFSRPLLISDLLSPSKKKKAVITPWLPTFKFWTYLAIKPVMVRIKREVVEIEKSEPMLSCNRCVATDRFVLVTQPNENDYIEGCRSIFEKFWHYSFHSWNKFNIRLDANTWYNDIFRSYFIHTSPSLSRSWLSFYASRFSFNSLWNPQFSRTKKVKY